MSKKDRCKRLVSFLAAVALVFASAQPAALATAEEPEEGPMREEPPEPEQEKMESFASESNPDWLIPPNESGEER